jgi:DNA-binding response OmpR family regulator
VGRATTVLVVDDEPQLRELMKVTLGAGYRFLEADDIDAALEAIRARPDLVLLDVMLPGGSGLEILREIRRDPDLDRTPVVVISAWQATEDRRVALDEGADAFLAKPFQIEELTAIVRELTRGRS